MSINHDEYFAALPPDRIGEAIIEKVAPYYQTRMLGGDSGTGGMLNAQVRAWMNHYGFGPSGLHASLVGRGGQVGELALVRNGLARALVTSLASMVTSSKMDPQPQADAWTYAAAQAVKIAKHLCEDQWNNEGVERYLALALEAALVQSEGYVHMEWDPTLGDEVLPAQGGDGTLRTGKVRYENLQTQDVIRDPGRPAFWGDGGLDWVFVRTIRNRFAERNRWQREAIIRGQAQGLGEYEIARNVREIGERCLSAPVLTFDVSTSYRPYAMSGQGGWNTDDIEVWRFYHRPNAILPNGRDIRVLGDGYVLNFDDLHIGRFPLARITPGEVINTPFGYTPLYEILGMQEVLDSLNSSLATTLTTLGTANIVTEQGTNIDIKALFGGMNLVTVPRGSKYPEALQLADVSPAHMPTMEYIEKAMREKMGQDQIDIGDRTAGSAIAIQDATILRKAGTLQTNYQNAAADVNTIMLRLFKQNATRWPVKISLGTSGGKGSRRGRIGVVASMLKDVDLVYMKMAPSAANSEAGRQQLALTIAQAKPDEVTARDLYSIATTGRPLDEISSGEEDQTLNAMHENELLAEGKPVRGLITDDHVEHAKTHILLLNDPANRDNPKVVNAVFTHLKYDHYSPYYGVYAPPLPPGSPQPTPDQIREATIYVVDTDPLYSVRMQTLVGHQPPPPAPPGMPGSLMGPNPAVANGTPPPAPGGGASATPTPAQPEVAAEARNGSATKPPRMPTNPETGEKWNPQTGGDAKNSPMQ